ncbi:MAG: hypothetical protein ACRDP6_26670 [Actinoallomurus sp.]
MSSSQAVRAISGQARSAITIYRFVVRDAASAQFDVVSGAQGEADGVAMESQATVGGSFPVALLDQGILKIELGTTLSAGAVVASDASGKAIAAVSGAGNYRLGKILDGGASGDIVRLAGLKELDQVT